MLRASDHLLRTLAAIPVASQILDLGCGEGTHTEPLFRLGFQVHACDARPDAVEATRDAVTPLVGDKAAHCVRRVPAEELDDFPDEVFDWVIAYRPTAYVHSPDDVRSILRFARRALKSGGWVYVAVPARRDPSPNGTPEAVALSPDELHDAGTAADLAVASAPDVVQEQGTSLVRAIFRRVDASTQP